MKTYQILVVKLLLLTGLSFSALGQSTDQNEPVYKISGKIMEAESAEPVSYATVALIEVATEKTVAGAVADFEGEFVITGFGEGTYKVEMRFVGFQPLFSTAFDVSANAPSVHLGELTLMPEAMALQEVTVVGQRELIEEKVDRTIYNAEYDKTLIGGDATDVMRRVPMLSVDMDGNISMRGSTSILVLINGKQSAIVASNVADALKQIPAEEIKAVEVITSPSAKYDAEGTGGVINIVTKKSNLKGATLNINSSVGLRGSNLGLNASLKKEKMAWTLGGFGRAGYNILGSFENQQLLTNADGSTLNVTQQADTRNNMLFGRYNFGWDYDINKYNYLTASVSFGLRNMKNKQDGLLTETFFEQDLLSSLLRDVNITNGANNVDVNFNYTKTFEQKGKEFSVSSLYSQSNLTNDFVNSLYNGSFQEVVSRIKNYNQGRNEEFTIQVDYVAPMGAGSKQILEYGAKNIMRRAESDFSYFTAQGPNADYQLVEDAAFSNAFSYDQNVTAGYVSFLTNFLEKYSFKGGVRYEYTNISADFRNTELATEIPSYGVFVPSINLSRRFDNGNMVKAAYNRRIQRPFLNFLNPNINAANPQQITQGNPLLDPELTDNYELSYSTTIKKTNLNFTSYFRNTTGAIQPVRTVMDDDVIFTTYENIGREKAYGLSMFANINISGKISLSGSVDSYFADLNNGLDDPQFAASNQGFVVSGRLFGSYSLPNNWQLQAFGFARGRQVQLQGSAGGFAVYSLSLNKQFNERKGSIGIGFENFMTREFKMRNELNTPNISQQSTVGMRNTSVKVNFNYRIGKLSMDQGRKKKRGVTNDDIKQGVNSNMDN